ncbi:uncharacterized protein LOC121689616 isoform X1 [Alosa sapidissima]|uniref:uncharacterized protein LOC121689616 isoform X1 n=1 Tax=Alosa sapidissima TaxID=34773 RepID=UPI001C0819DF|nr:uncharacterized protein LOC121689616 isoform X1 [Alosa sapidissima]
MACTNQSAVDFIKKAWIHLVKNLKHQELIAENLEELGVFNFDDVTAVTSEKNPLTQTRNLLDSVTKKGEEASYVFLRILDGKKNMTLPKNVRPDLHYWISCFPFREESDLQPNGPRSCQLYQAQLKTKALKILHTHTEQINFVFGRNAVQCFSYTPLVLDRAGQGYAEPTKIKQKTKKYKKSRPKKLSAYIPKSKPQLSPDYLLECNEQSILLVGKPGIGKTTVALEMINLWVKKENCKLNYLFYFDETTLCGMSSPVDLESLLFGAYAEPSLNRDEVLEDIKKNSEHVTIIVDNINSVQRNSVLRKIFDKDLLPEAKVVVTCRLDYEEFLSIETCLRVCVEGFSEESIQTYMSHMLRDKPDALSYILGNPEMFSLCYVPVNALMVAACMLFPMTVTSNLFTTTEVYLNIFRQIMKKCDSDLTLRQLDKFIQCNMEKIQDLSKDAFLAINQRSIVLEGCDDTNIEHNFLHLLTMRDGPTSVKTYSAFLHNTLQEFFAAIWLLSNPGDIDGFFHQCKTDEGKHMRHVIPFLCGLLSERNLSLVSCICPEERIKVTSTGFIEKLLSLYINADQDFEDSNEELLFLCQCLFELQSLQACSVFLSRVNYNLDLADGHLHPHQCCTLSYVIKQARMKVVLDLENCRISKQGLNFILDCNEYVRIDSSLLRQIWTATLSWENPGVFPDLLKLSGPEMHLPAWDLSVFERAGEMIRQHPQQMSLVLHCHQSAQSLSEDLCSAIVSVLPHITSLRFTEEELNEYPKGVFRFLLDLSVAAAVSDSATGQSFSELLCSVCTFPFEEIDRCADYYNGSHNEFLLDLCSKVKDIEILKGRSLLPALRPFYQSAPAVWSIDLSKRKASLLLEVLKLQTQKKPVELRGWSDEESEVRSFLQCLPYISQLSCTPPQSEGMSLEEWERSVKSFHLHLCLQTALYEWTSVRTLMTLFSVSNEFDFLLDLYYYVRDYESQMGSSLIPALRPVYKFTLAVWSIDLSKRKASLLLEVLKLHTQKKPVELRGWSDEESEVRSFLQCLPYISQLSCTPPQSEGMSLEEWERSVKSFHLHLCLQTALYEWTSVRTLMTLFSVSNESDFLLDLYYYVRDYESQIGRSLIPALRPIYHFTLAVWSIDLSKRKASLLLEVLKLQTQKKPVELRGWSDEESDVSSFLQCLPYISQLRFTEEELNEYPKGVFRFLLDLSVAAAVSDSATGQSFSELLCSVCTFPFEEIDRCADYYNGSHNEFLLDLCSKVKDIEILKGRSLLPALRPFYQSAPAVWSIDLSKRKASLLLEVLKLQTQKKPVELRGWSDEESEVRSFLQCLPYISQLSCTPPQSEGMSLEEWERSVKSFHLHLCLQTALYEWTSVRTLMTLFSVSNESDFLLDLYYYVRDYESQIGRSLIPALRPVYKFTLAVWSIDLSKRKASLLLEVLKLQTQKKPVELRGWSDEESEVRSFLQCLPYISQLRFGSYYFSISKEEVFQVLVNLSVAAAEHDAATGERFSEFLSSVCSYSTFPFGCDVGFEEISDFLLDLCSHIKACETNTYRSVHSVLQSMFQSASEVWYIDLSTRKASVLLEVLKLQTQKKPVEMEGWSDEESEVRSFLQCLPYMSQLRFREDYLYPKSMLWILLDLSVAAAVSDSATGESCSELLCSVCTFPFEEIDEDYNRVSHSEFLLDLCFRVKDIEIQTGRSLLPAFKPFYQSTAAPAVWSIDLSKRKASVLLEVLKLQTQKKPVELEGWSDEESEVRSFLQCLPYISQLSLHCDYDGKVFLLGCAAVWSTEELIHLVQLLDNIELKQDLYSRDCRSLARVLIVASKLDLTLTPEHISLRGVRLLFRGVTHLHKLRLNITMVMRLARAMRTGRGLAPVSVEELSLYLNSKEVSQRVLSRVLSCLALLLRLWTVQCLDLTSCRVEGHSLIILLCQQDPLKLRLSKENTQQLFMLVSDAQNVEIIESFLNKVGGDLTSCTLTQEVLLHLLQHHSGPVTVDFRKSKITERNVRDFLHLLDRIRFKRLSPGFIMFIIMEIYQSRSAQYVSSLLRSTENHINLTTRGLDAADCAALRFTLQHSQGVRLNLMWTSIPEGELESLLKLLTNVSQLSVDRQLLLRILHCCYSSDAQQGAAAALLQALQHRLDFSCSSAMDLTEETQEPPLHLTPEDCMVVSMVIQRVSVNPELMLMDCDVEEVGLEHLFSVLERIRLRCSKGQLLQLLTLVCVGSERECVRRAVSLSHAVGGEVDLSHTVLDARACGSLALFLEYSEGLSELDLSHCQLTDHCLEPLLSHLHKSQTLDLSNNSITDEGAQLIHNTVNAATSIQTVRLFNNKIRSRQLFQGDARFELW